MLIWCITLIDFQIWRILVSLEYTQLDHCVWAFLCVVEFCLLNFCWGFLHLCPSVILAIRFFFCVVVIWLWYQNDGGLIDWVWKCPFLCKFWKNFRRIGICFCLNVWDNYPVKPSGPGLLFFRRHSQQEGMPWPKRDHRQRESSHHRLLSWRSAIYSWKWFYAN